MQSQVTKKTNKQQSRSTCIQNANSQLCQATSIIAPDSAAAAVVAVASQAPRQVGNVDQCQDPSRVSSASVARSDTTRSSSFRQILDSDEHDRAQQASRQEADQLTADRSISEKSEQQSHLQRIKVTLSAPRNSTDQSEQQYSAEPILLDDAQVATTTTGRSRSQCDEQLRRIASQRRQVVRPESLRTGSGTDSPSDARPGDQQRPVATACDLGAVGLARAPPYFQQQQPDNPKQLAIYINGKIRSNSIFCRSTSSTSFSSILNRFHPAEPSSVNSGPVGDGACDKYKGTHSRRTRRGPARSKCTQLGLLNRLHLRLSGWRFLLTGRSKAGDQTQVALASSSSSGSTGDSAEGSRSNSRSSCTKVSLELDTNKTADEQADKLADAGAAETGGGHTTTSYKLNPSSMFLKKAMRYYRLWIYCTNITILLGTLIFILASIYVLSDFRFKLLVRTRPSEDEQLYYIRLQRQQLEQYLGPSKSLGASDRSSAVGEQLEPDADKHIHADPSRLTPPTSRQDANQADNFYIRPSEPCVLLAYAAIAIQAGLLQAIGCFGALRMKERWIQIFWYLIVTLTVFDVVIAMYWLGRFTDLKQSLEGHMRAQLALYYGQPTSEPAAGSLSHLSFDKTLTEIIDKIQAQSQCCGISNASDFESSLWRQVRVKELEIRFETSELAGNAKLANSLIGQIPMVPASCCRPKQPTIDANRPVIFEDDSQVKQAARVPAWSPSMAIERLDERNQLPIWRDSARLAPDAGGQSRNPGDANWQAQARQAVTGAPDVGLSKQQRRLLAKQANFNRRTGSDQSESSERLARRWALESRVDQQGEVLSRLVAVQADQSATDNDAGQLNTTSGPDLPGHGRKSQSRAAEAQQELLKLEQILFEPASSTSGPLDAHLSSARARRSVGRRFRWPNALGLSADQYKTIEAYLLREMRDGRELTDSGSKQTGLQLPVLHAPDQQKGWTLSEDSGSSKRRSRRRRDIGRPGSGNRWTELRDWVRSSSPELGCAPSSYVDRASIFTRGCEPAIEAWLDSSAHLMFVTGFCILTVLKFCSVILLRLEIREMIHKIRVLKGMATEYNALQDLEAYLPRPSLCAQAAELTPTGVAAAIGPPPGGPVAAASLAGVSTGICSQVAQAAGAPDELCLQGLKSGSTVSGRAGGASPSPVHRIGGSFSEAVVAATAAAAAAQHQPASSLLAGPIGCGLTGSSRAASMKAMSSLAPSPCPRSSSAHLQTAASLLAGGPRLRCDPFASPAGVMSRRHTAISVCPAAASAAAAAVQHLIDRRGTCVAATNPLFGLAGAGSASLSQHRHSAHTIQSGQTASHLNPTMAHRHSSASAHTRSAPGQHRAAGNSCRHLGEASLEQQSSADSAEHQQRSSVGSNQLLSLMYPFKRQSSDGAQSADCNFCPDLTGALSSESRRSIH